MDSPPIHHAAGRPRALRGRPADLTSRRPRMSHAEHDERPLIVGLGGTTRPGSSSERALAVALGAAQELGAGTELIAAADLQLPLYPPERPERPAEAVRLAGA